MKVYNNSNQYNTLPDNKYYTPKQLILPLEIETIIDFNDPVNTFDEVMRGCNLEKYLITDVKDPRGRIGYNTITMLKVILFAFMIKGYCSTRELADLCKNDIRFRWLLRNENSFPSHMTIANFMNQYMKNNVENIFKEINGYIFKEEKVNTDIVYIDGSKLEANANKYKFVWKKGCIKQRNKTFIKVTSLLQEINDELLCYEMTRYSLCTEYSIEYLEYVIKHFKEEFRIDITKFVSGKGKRKSQIQKYYEKLNEYMTKLKEYSHKIKISGEIRNSYAKTDVDATFMRVKKDYMGNGQLLPAYNLQLGVCDEYIAVCEAYQYSSDHDTFQPLLDKYRRLYNKYPKYPVADAGYGSYNNYLYCEEKGMEKYQKFTMYQKETHDDKYHSDPFRSVNFKKDNEGHLICPNNKKFYFLKRQPVRYNKFERTEEIYECEDCTNCSLKNRCHTSDKNRRIKLNEELTSIHQEVIDNLQSDLGIQLRINRSIQAEGAFGVIKYDRWYKRIVRKGLKSVNLEIHMVSTGYNLYKYHNKKYRLIS